MEKIGEAVEDTKIVVPTSFINFPLGFAIDAGGSVAKLLYRSKSDYTNCIANKADEGEAVLRLRYFPIRQHDDVVQFIKHHVDICAQVFEEEHKGSVWWQTGITTTHFKAKLEAALNIKTKLLSEMQAISKIATLLKDESVLDRKPPSRYAVEYMAKNVNEFLDLMEVWKNMGDSAFDCVSTVHDEEADKVVTTLTVLVSKSDFDGIIQQLKKIQISFPCLLLLCGSAFVLIRLEEDGTYKPVDFLTTGGKTFMALGEELTDAEDFDDLINLAQRGDNGKVDICCGDLKDGQHNEDDWYNPMPTDAVVFSLGKLSKHNVHQRGAFTKEDLAAGFVNMFCEQTAKWSLLNARVQNVRHVIVTGSFVNAQYVKERLESYFLTNSLLTAVEERIFINAHFLSNPGFMCSLGVWLKNLEDQGKPT